MKINPQHPAGEIGLKFMISDFGMAKLKAVRPDSYDCVTVWKLGDLVPYFAPECRMGNPVGQSADIWALGCILLEIVSYALLGFQEGDMKFSMLRTTTLLTQDGDRKNSAFFETTQGNARVKVPIFIQKVIAIPYLTKCSMYALHCGWRSGCMHSAIGMLSLSGSDT